MVSFQIGSISNGTLRLQDLIPTLLDTLKEIAEPEAYEAFINSRPRVPESALTDDDDDYWDFNNEEMHMLLGDLFDELQVRAPPGTYFGWNEDEVANLGFWSE